MRRLNQSTLNRPRYVVQNLYGQAIEVNTPPAYDANYPDRNVRSETVYDASGNAIATIDTLGRIQRTYYDALNRAETVIENLTGQGIEMPTPPSYNPNYPDQNLRTDYVYDEAGNLIATVDPSGAITRTYYDALNRSVTVVNNLTGQTIENPIPPTFNPSDPDANVRSDTVYDAVGNVIASIDTLGHVTRTYYDALDRPYLVVQNLYPPDYNNPTPPAYNPSYWDRNIHSETVSDQDGKTIASIDNAGSITRTYYDELSRPVVVVRNLIGQPITNPTPPAYNPAYPDQNVRTETVYGPGGNVQKTIDPNGKVIYTCYDGLNRTVKTIENPTVGNPCGSYTPSSESDHDIITQSTYDGLGNRVSARDANNKETVYQYDNLNRLISERDPLLHTTSYAYDGLGNRISVTDARNVVTRFEYDGVNRLKAVVENYRQGETPTNEVNVRTEYTYDGMGNRRAIRDALNHMTTFDYDGLNRLISESDALSHTTMYGYNGEGNRISLLDANGSTIYFEYDSLNRLITIDYLALDADVHYTYDAAGNRSDMTDGMGTTHWAYDGLYRPQSITDPFSGISIYGYDAAGNRKSITYPNTKSVVYTYDHADRLQTVNSWGSLATNYSYDKVGRTQSVTLPNTIVSNYGYDDASHLTSLSHTKGAQTLSSFQYQYDEVGNRTRAAETVFQPPLQNTGLKSATSQAPNTTDGDMNGFEVSPANALADGGGFAVDNKSGTNNSTNCDDAGKDKHNFYTFNFSFPVNTNLIQGIEARLDAKVDSTSYTPQMCVEFSWNGGTSWTAAKKTPTLTTSESTYILGGSSDTWGRTWNTTELSNTNFKVRVINIASSKNKNFSLDWVAVKVYYKYIPTIDYTYDPLYRLTTANYNDGRYYQYTYDAVGNRLTEQTHAGNSTYSYDIANRLTSVNGVTYTWDNNGNLLNDGVYTYAYDRANRLKTASGQGSNYSFGYNGNGDRLQQTVNSVTTNYTLDLNAGLTQVLSDGSITYLYGNARILQDRGTSKEYFLTDALGSVRQLADASGAVILGKNYQPYGKLLDSSGSGTSSYGFTGEWTDTTGLINLRARYYNPFDGIFSTRDKVPFDIQKPSTYGWYRYAYGNPINNTDPSGMCVFCKPYDRVKVHGENNGPVNVYKTADSTEVIGRLNDNQYVTIMGNIIGSTFLNYRDEKRYISYQTLESPYPRDYGYIRNMRLLDNCSVPGGGFFGCLPVTNALREPGYGFGPNQFAKDICSDKYSECPYYNTRGLHNGLDFSVGPDETLIWAGKGKGYVVALDTGDANWNIVIQYGGRSVVYGHVDNDEGYRLVRRKDEVEPGQMIGKVGDGDDTPNNKTHTPHLHFGLRYKTIFYNPVDYFTQQLQDQINANLNPYPDPWNPYIMLAFDTGGIAWDGTDLQHKNFWKATCKEDYEKIWVHYWP